MQRYSVTLNYVLNIATTLMKARRHGRNVTADIRHSEYRNSAILTYDSTQIQGDPKKLELLKKKIEEM
jgi:hypothetical protein